MKLRNKKTGKIIEKMYPDSFVINSDEQVRLYNSLAELNEEWEDYEKPKDTNYWCIDSLGKIEFHSTVLDEIDGTPNNDMIRKIIGNYFDTREEAGQAVEKLKAWKRLKDAGFKFSGWETSTGKAGGVVETKFNLWERLTPEITADLDLCFGGKDEL